MQWVQRTIFFVCVFYPTVKSSLSSLNYTLSFSHFNTLYCNCFKFILSATQLYNSVITTIFVLFLKSRYSKGCRYYRNRE